MPELPEVETVSRQLAPLLVTRVVRSITILDPRLREAARDDLAGRPIRSVERLGKQVVIALGGANPLWLAVHLRMTGRLQWLDAPPAARQHLRAIVALDRGVLVFVDPRRFGTLTWLDAPRALETGIDPTREAFTPECLAGLLRGSRQELKTWLLRQDRIVGLGNIYASEILDRARLHPSRPAGTLRAGEVLRLHAATCTVLAAAIENCGTTFSDFQDAHGVTGNYQQFLRVYGREGEPCARCGGSIRRTVQGQRSTYHCPRCVRPWRGRAVRGGP